MKINKILNFSSVDGPGNRLVVFTQGCNLNCLYCHNPETIDFNQEGFNIDPPVLVDRILEAIKFISGVTFTGGECSLQAEELIETCKLLKKQDIEIYLDTNFSLKSDIYYRLAEVTDRFIVDLKAIDESSHIKLTGSTNRQIIDNIRLFYDKIYEVRTVIVPGMNDTPNEMEDLFKFILSVDPFLTVKLIRFRPYGVRKPYDELEIPDTTFMEEWMRKAVNMGLKNVYYR
jgi:pyruvate-formate lyase-activating enzyme